VQANQLRNTALGKIMLERNIDQYFEDAMRLEARFVGIDINAEQPKINGEIIEFLVDDLGYSVTWTLDVKYIIDGCYNETHNIVKKTSKFGDVFGELRNVMKDNIELLFSDQQFQTCILSTASVLPSLMNQGESQGLSSQKTDHIEMEDGRALAVTQNEAKKSIETKYPKLVAEIGSESEVEMRNAAKQAGESKFYNDPGIIAACLERLEAAPSIEITKKQKFLIDGLAWCALNVGNSRDQRGNTILANIVASTLPKKIRNASIHALKVIRGDIPVK